MHPAVVVAHDQKRKCGVRKVHGLYLMADRPAMPCCKLPFPLTICPCCGAGIKFSRAWTWVDTNALLGQSQCVSTAGQKHCPLAVGVAGRAGLLWIGAKFYKTPYDYNTEADEQGLSRRIKFVPHDFKLGETWVLLAHINGILKPTVEEIQTEDLYIPAIFRVFRPTRIEYILSGSETDEEIDKLVKRGLTPVIVQKEQEPVQNGLDME